MTIGFKKDQDKIDPTIVPTKAILAIAVGLMFGQQKYVRNNHKHVEEGDKRFTAAGLRHLLAHAEGVEEGILAIDEESNLPHLVLAACSLVIAMHHFNINPKQLLANMNKISSVIK